MAGLGSSVWIKCIIVIELKRYEASSRFSYINDLDSRAKIFYYVNPNENIEDIISSPDLFILMKMIVTNFNDDDDPNGYPDLR